MVVYFAPDKIFRVLDPHLSYFLNLDKMKGVQVFSELRVGLHKLAEVVVTLGREQQDAVDDHPVGDVRLAVEVLVIEVG